ncbi:CPBP family intramembrane metalloprotease [Bifidobacterium pseudolongum]|uniref:CPBP family intramembrane glutamic endopeptidase n=1 Tax=Bifidobacterium pseudolongum TaxID=1694 RepID=UPI001CE0EE71|nr:type II CAAX endopeptidase family protein [Bifidobacterium pseudolongum]UBY94251.1 CPBP family intramembrane metalloprotease [Bifidobacterium pseudolongum]UBZ03084.1 CPBP family intramembrane metalloprotease [Bifidobacterium pseudolongum]UBZ04657.1 CPBP family intramembrane metalloprotease [Bifidobacterium pseudolongum]UDL23669.1 CPBP family intramembrane metalloprotease [Bifidobacterium pseudolongum]
MTMPPQQPQRFQPQQPQRPPTHWPPVPPMAAMRPAPAPSPWQARITAAKRAYSRAGAAIALMLVVWVLLTLLLQGAVAGMLRTPQLSMWLSVVISSGVLYCIALPLGFIVLRTEPMLPTRRFTLKPSRFLMYLLIALPITYAGNIIGIVLSALLSGGQASNRILDMTGGSDWVVNIVAAVLLAPIVEEWLFRKQLIGRLRRFGELPAILVSALFFALFHLNLFQFFYAFGLGVLFGYVYMRTSKLRYTVGLHMLINANGGIVAPWFMNRMMAAIDANLTPDTLTGAQMGALIGGLTYAFLLLAATLAGLVLLIVRWKRREFYLAPEQLPHGAAGRAAFGNPGVITCIAVGTLGTLLMLFA